MYAGQPRHQTPRRPAAFLYERHMRLTGADGLSSAQVGLSKDHTASELMVTKLSALEVLIWTLPKRGTPRNPHAQPEFQG